MRSRREGGVLDRISEPENRHAGAPTIEALAAENLRLRAALAEREQAIDTLQAMAVEGDQLRLLADTLPVLIFYADRDYRIRYHNRAFAGWFGGDGTLLGRALADLLGAEGHERLRPLFDRALAGERIGAELTISNLKGERLVRMDLIADRRPSGRTAGLFALVQDVTEARQAEQTLRESEARFRAMADCAPSPVWVTGRDGIEFVNRAFCEVAGRPAEALAGEEWVRMIHGDDLPLVLSRRDEAWRTRSAYAYLARFRRGDGAWRWMQVSCNPRLDPEGELAGYVGLAVDQTDQKAAEAELRESEARFRAMADSAPAPVWVTNEAGIEFANQSLADFTGLTVDQLRGDVWMSLVHPEDLEPVRLTREAAWAAERPYQFECRFRRHDGEWRWLRASCRPRRSEGAFLGYVGLAIDITESRRAEQELRESEALLRAMFDHAGVGMVQMEPDCRIIEANPAFAAILGRDAGDLVGKTLLSLAHPQDEEDFGAAVAAIRAGATAFALEKRFLDRSGAALWGRTTVSRAGARLLAVVEDVTDRRRAEAALLDLNQSLEQRVQEAMKRREQAEAALRQAQKMEAVGQLTGGIAHDFNNLLTVISGNIDLALRRAGADADARLVRPLASAMAGAQRAATLTQRLLAFSRRQPLNPRPIDANQLLSGMTELIRRTLGETIRVETRLSERPLRTEADPNQLESAILNLAVNARDAMPTGGRLLLETTSLLLSTGDVEESDGFVPGPYVSITVGDTGTGMDEETVRRSIEPFFTTKEVGKGTGLGLSMVYGFVRQSGGHLRIDSREGEGTRVEILLPRLGGEEERQEPEREEERVKRARPGEVVLVCEDDEDVRRFTAELLGELGYDVLEAADAAATLRIVEQGQCRVDLLFTDLVLPGGSGGTALADAARALRPDLKILFTSGYSPEEFAAGARLAPADLVTKPFSLAGLAERLRAVLDR